MIYQYLVGYFLSFNIIITGILTVILYTFSYKKLENEILESGNNMLIQLKSGIDVILSQIDGFLNQVTMDTAVANFMEYREKKNYEMQLKIANQLYDFTILNNYVDSIRIYFCENEKILAVESGFWSVEDFEDQELINLIRNGNIRYWWIPVRKIFSEERSINKYVITVVKPIPLIDIHHEVVIIINIKEQYIKNLVKSICSTTLGSVFIVNNDGDILSHVNNSRSYMHLETQEYFKNALKYKQGRFRDIINGDCNRISQISNREYAIYRIGWYREGI